MTLMVPEFSVSSPKRLTISLYAFLSRYLVLMISLSCIILIPPPRKKEKEDERKRRLRETREMRKTLLIDVGGA